MGDAGVCIAACKFLVSPCAVAHTYGGRQMFLSHSSSSASISRGVFESVCLPECDHACHQVCVSVCQLGRCVSVHPQRVTPVTFDTLSASCLTECLVLAKVNLCLSVDPTQRRKAVGKKKKKRRWKEGVWRDASPAETGKT